MLKKYFSLLWFIALLGIAGVIGWQSLKNSSSTSLPLGTVAINHVVFRVEVAATDASTKQGLSGRKKLEPNQGMYFMYPVTEIQQFWMKDMKFPLDIIWIKDNTIVGITANIPVPAPHTALSQLKIYPSPQAVNCVLEVNAGVAATHQFKIGDKVIFRPL